MSAELKMTKLESVNTNTNTNEIIRNQTTQGKRNILINKEFIPKNNDSLSDYLCGVNQTLDMHQMSEREKVSCFPARHLKSSLWYRRSFNRATS